MVGSVTFDKVAFCSFEAGAGSWPDARPDARLVARLVARLDKKLARSQISQYAVPFALI
jgi:hypothetical protein